MARCSYCQETVDENVDEFDRCEDCTIECLSCGDIVEEVDDYDRGLVCCATNCAECEASFMHPSSSFCNVCRPRW